MTTSLPLPLKCLRVWWWCFNVFHQVCHPTRQLSLTTWWWCCHRTCGITFTAGTVKHLDIHRPLIHVILVASWISSVQMYGNSPLRYGGGPAVNHLYVCHTCQTEIEKLEKRRKSELDMFVRVSLFNFVFTSQKWVNVNALCVSEHECAFSILLVYLTSW